MYIVKFGNFNDTVKTTKKHKITDKEFHVFLLFIFGAPAARHLSFFMGQRKTSY